MHVVTLDRSFAERFVNLPRAAQEEIAAILRNLQTDPYFVPDDEDYVVQSSSESGLSIVACQHINDWDGWAMAWGFEYFDAAPATLESIVVTLYYSPPQEIHPVDHEIGRATGVAGILSGAMRGAIDRARSLFKVAENTGSCRNENVVRIFYATDRDLMNHEFGNIRFGFKRSPSGQLNYGHCKISSPRQHKIGNLEAPSVWLAQSRLNPNEHIVLTETQKLDENEFFCQVSASIAQSKSRDALVFVHGFNVVFEDAARRTGQIATDLGFPGATICYSWPSHGSIKDYVADSANISWSIPHLQRFLELLAARSGAKRIHLLAHSMGTRAVCDALKAISTLPKPSLRLNHLILAAPDIDADTFREQFAGALQKVSRKVTIYESSKDKAIEISSRLHRNRRVGEPLQIIPGLDTVDASLVDTDFMGHSTFANSRPLLSDIHALLFDDKPAEKRFGLEERIHPDGSYFAFRA